MMWFLRFKILLDLTPKTRSFLLAFEYFSLKVSNFHLNSMIYIKIFFYQKVLEACAKNCGERFHDLIGRFRFLNEMIKIVSPKVKH